ncbi:MAG: OPT family oligopeptide transporter [Patescibacteria group bacterium]
MIQELTPEQKKNWTLKQKDEWWLKNVYRGDMPQLTIRSAITGALLGSVLCLTNLYIGIKTGWTLGVGITSVILSYAAFKMLAKAGLGKEMTILENNAMQSCATAAGYMTGPLVASIPAYMMITSKVLPQWQVITWVFALALMGVLFAFPLKKRFINDEQHDFPEGKACGVVLDGLHDEKQASDSLLKTRILLIAGSIAAVFTYLRSEKLMDLIHLKFLTIPDYLEDILFKFTTWRPTIFGSKFQDLTIGIETDLAMFAAGGLMSVKTGVSLIVGAFINYFILAPYLIKIGIIGEASFKAITMWSLWGGVAMMATASIFSFFSKPAMIISAFTGMFKKNKQEDILKDIELPLKVSVIGIPIVSVFLMIMGKIYFGISPWLTMVAIPLIFVFTLIAVNSTALTSITPSGALGKLTQVTFAVIAPGQPVVNIMAAGASAESAGNSSNLLMDIKPGYMLGAKPRHQAVAHVIGAFVGICVAVPVFYMLFNGDISMFGSKQMTMPGATIWKAVTDALSVGLSALHPTAQVSVLIGGVLGVVLEWCNQKFKWFPVSPVGLGLAFILQCSTSFIMAAGSITFWAIGKFYESKDPKDALLTPEQKEAKEPKTLLFKVAVKNHETLCAGLIAGAALMGIVSLLVTNMLK